MASKTAVIKKKKKSWFPIHAPDFMNNMFLGESNVYDKEELIGKTLNLNVSTITNDMKKQNINATFRVTGVVEGKGKTEIINYELSQSYIKRLVRRGRNKISDSFVVMSKDKKQVRVKPIIITNSKAHKSIVSRIRLMFRDIIKKYMAKSTFDDFTNDLMSMRLQKELRDKLGKIHPLKYVDVRQALIETKKAKIDDSEPLVEELETEETVEEKAKDQEEEKPVPEKKPRKKTSKKKAEAEETVSEEEVESEEK